MKHVRKYLSLAFYFLAQLLARVSCACEKSSLYVAPKSK